MSWWNPGSWVSDADSDVVHTVDDVKKWVEKRVSQAVSLLGQDLDDVRSWATQALKDAGDALQAVADAADKGINDAKGLAQDLATDAENAAENLVRSVENELNNAIHSAENTAVSLVNDAKAGAAALFHDAETFATDALHTFDKDIVQPLIADVKQDVKDLEKYADDALHTFNKDVIDPIDTIVKGAVKDLASATAWLNNQGRDAYEFAIGAGKDTYDIVVKASDWLAWFGAHTIADIESLGKSLEHDVSLSWVENWINDNGEAIVSQAKQLASPFLGS